MDVLRSVKGRNSNSPDVKFMPKETDSGEDGKSKSATATSRLHCRGRKRSSYTKRPLKTVRDRSHDRNSNNIIIEVQDRTDRDSERNQEDSVEQQPQQLNYAPQAAYGSADAACTDSNRTAALGMMPSSLSYSLFAGMNPQGGMTMNVVPNSGFGMMGLGGQYGWTSGPPSFMAMGAKEVLHLSKCTLYPPNSNSAPPGTRERPVGCKTVFVGGLPENATEEVMKEIFERCGEILAIRMSKKNFCHIRFASEHYVYYAIWFSGYRIKIDDKDDAANTGRMHVDYAEARDDQYEYECRQRALHREARHRENLEYGYDPPIVVRFTDEEANAWSDKLRNEETFQQAICILVSWLEKNECNKKNSSYFYSMIQSTNNHVRRLMNEKVKHEEELNKAKMMLKQQMQAILLQFNEIGKVFNAASLQKVWDHFTKPQRKNIEIWKKQAEEIKNAVEEALTDRIEDDMDISEDGSENSEKEDGEIIETNEHPTVNITAEVQRENNSFPFKAEESQDEASLSSFKMDQERDLKDRQLRALRLALQKMQEEMINMTQKHAKEEAELEVLRAYKLGKEATKNQELGECSHKGDGKELHPRNSIMEDTNLNLQCQALTLRSFCAANDNMSTVSAKETVLLSFISIFLYVHPFGASIDYICSYLHKIDQAINVRDIESLMKKFPIVFKEESTGIGASLEKKWFYCGFESQI